MSSRRRPVENSRALLSRAALVEPPESASAPEDHGSAWFDCDPSAVFVIGVGAIMLKANTAARRLLETGSVELRAGRICFVDLDSRRSFAAAVLRVLSGPGAPQTRVLRTNDGQWRRVTLCQCSADPSSAFLAFGAGKSEMTSVRALWKAFGLSPAESEVLQMLTDGLAPKEIATQLGISPHTVRAHLRSLYLKAHVRGISGLIRECSRLTA